MCEATTAAIAGAAVLAAAQSRRQSGQARRQNRELMTQQERAEEQRQLQALEDRAEEQRRQQQIQRGITQIDNLFSAFGLQPLAPEEGFDQFNLPDRFDPNDPRVQRALETGDFSTFGTSNTQDLRDRQPDQGIFGQRRQQFLDFANPQFDRQFANQRDNLTFALTRGGLGQSSVAAQRTGVLGEQANEARQQIANQAQSQADQLRSQVLDTRQNLVSQLHATGDPQLALAGAGERLQAVQAQPAFNPLGQIFQGVTEGLAGFQQGRQRGASGIPLSGFFNRQPGGAGSSRVVGGG